MNERPTPKGRGSGINPPNRFRRLVVERGKPSSALRNIEMIAKGLGMSISVLTRDL